MSDPLSMLASVAGVVALAASTARTLISLTQEMADAPQEILHVRRDVQNLSTMLKSIQELCVRYDLGPESYALMESLTECLSLCQDSMQSIRTLLEPLAANGSGRRSPIRMVGWVMRKGEIKALRERLQEGKTSLNITVSVLNGLLEGKGQDEIKHDVNQVYEKLAAEFRSRDIGKRVRRRMEDDVASVSAFGVRRQSISELTDTTLPMNRFFDQLPEPSMPNFPPYQPNSQSSSQVLLSPFSTEPTTLLEAVRARDKDGVIRLVSSGLSTVERTQDGQTALHFCAIYNDAEITEILLDHGADINARDNQLRSPLNVAISSEAMGVANLLVQRGCSLSGSMDMIFPLTQRMEEIPGLETFLKTLAPKFNKSTSGPYLLHQAIESSDTQTLDILLSAGFDPNIKNKYGLPPLYQALMSQQKQAVRALLKYGANGNDYLPPGTREKLDKHIHSHERLAHFIDNGLIPLEVSARIINDVEMTRILLESGADPNFIYPADGGVVLSGLGDEEYLECAKLIIDHGARIHAMGFNGLDPFYWANGCRNPRLIEYMLLHGADINHFYNDNYPSILFFVVEWGHRRTVDLLLRYNPNLTLKNGLGETLLDIAQSAQRHQIVAMLKSAIENTATPE